MSTKLFAKNLMTAICMFALAVLGVLGGCSKPDTNQPVASTPIVTVMTVQPTVQSFTTELSGRTRAFMVSDIRPQVGGIVQKRLFVEGAEVRAGQALYQLDAATYKAALAEAQATLAKGRATLKSAQLTARRDAGLAKIDAISQQDNEDAQAAVLTADAEVKVAQAGVESARINLAYTTVTSPISGRIETSTVTPGALVVASQDTALTTVQQLDPIYVDVTQSTTDLLRLKRQLAAGILKGDATGETPITLVLEDGSTYAHQGQLKFSGVSVSESTGTVILRAVVPNPDGLLMPGMYVRGLLEQGHDDNAILLPQKAVTRNKDGSTFVWVVTRGKVEQRQVTINRAVENQWCVSAGLSAGEQIVIEGGQKISAGASVQTVQVGSVNQARSATTASTAREG